MRGIPYSTLANRQVAAHVVSSRVKATTRADFPFIAYNTEIYNLNMTGPRVPIDGRSAWPLDQWLPNLCLAKRRMISPKPQRDPGR